MRKKKIMRNHTGKAGLIVKNSLAWLLIHMGIAFLITRLPATLFSPAVGLFRPQSWEKNGAIYEQLFGVSRWKNKLPDGATWFAGGFAKRKLTMNNSTYLERFVRETCRGELVHWLVIASAPVFLLWNTVTSFMIIILYALVANIPCIIAQRYNRPRLQALLRRMKRREAELEKQVKTQ